MLNNSSLHSLHPHSFGLTAFAHAPVSIWMLPLEIWTELLYYQTNICINNCGCCTYTLLHVKIWLETDNSWNVTLCLNTNNSNHVALVEHWHLTSRFRRCANSCAISGCAQTIPRSIGYLYRRVCPTHLVILSKTSQLNNKQQPNHHAPSLSVIDSVQNSNN